MEENTEATKKQKRKVDRRKRRDDRVENMVTNQAKQYGVDLDSPTAPVTESRKGEIDATVKKAIGDEAWKGIDTVSSSSTAPAGIDNKKPDKDQLLDSARRERKARWGDALTAFGAGLQGRIVPQEQMLSRKIARERDTQFQDYKRIRDKNSQTQNLWEQQYQQQLIGHAMKQAENNKLSAGEREKYKQMADQLKLQNDKFQAEYGKGGIREQEIAQDKRKLDMMERGTYGSTTRSKSKTETDLENDASYQLRKKQYLLDVRQQEGKEAEEKLKNNLKGYEADISNLENEKYKIEAAKKDLGFGNKAEKAEYDKQIAEIDKKIAATNQTISDAFKGINTQSTKTPTKDDKLEEFFN